jgi:hypothetical protein
MRRAARFRSRGGLNLALLCGGRSSNGGRPYPGLALFNDCLEHLVERLSRLIPDQLPDALKTWDAPVHVFESSFICLVVGNLMYGRVRPRDVLNALCQLQNSDFLIIDDQDLVFSPQTFFG